MRFNVGDSSHWGNDLCTYGWTDVNDGDEDENNNNNNNLVLCYKFADTTNRPVTVTALQQKVNTQITNQ